MKKILGFLALALLAVNAWAQQALFSGNDIISPEVNSDGTVTFRLYAPKAVKVELTGDFLPKVKVQSPKESALTMLTLSLMKNTYFQFLKPVLPLSLMILEKNSTAIREEPTSSLAHLQPMWKELNSSKCYVTRAIQNRFFFPRISASRVCSISLAVGVMIT